MVCSVVFDCGKPLCNAINRALNKESNVSIKGRDLVYFILWWQKISITVHLVNLTNPLMTKGPFTELIQVAEKARIKIRGNKNITAVHLLMAGQNKRYGFGNRSKALNVSKIADHEMKAVDFKSSD